MKRTRWLAFGCTHLPIHSEEFRQWRLQHIRDYKPDVVINLGDWQDGDAASRWDNENDWDLEEEFRLLAEDAKDINEAAPDAIKVWVRGNHDENISAAARLPQKVRSLCQWQNRPECAEQLKDWKVIPYSARALYRLGPVTFQHGTDTSLNGDRNQSLLYGVPYGLWVGAHSHRPVPVTRIVIPGRIPLFGVHFCNVGTGADWHKMDYIARSNIALWGRAIAIGECNAGKDHYTSKEWDAQIVMHSVAH